MTTADSLLPQPPPTTTDPPELLASLRRARRTLELHLETCAKLASAKGWAQLATEAGAIGTRTADVTKQCKLAPHHQAGLVSKLDEVIPAMNPKEATKTGGLQEFQRLNETLTCLANGLGWGNRWPDFPSNGEWGSEHHNAGWGLPNGFTYLEFYVRPWKLDAKGTDGICRVVVGSDRRVWYSRSHYGKYKSEGPAYVRLDGVTRP